MFKNRKDAGQQLAKALKQYKGKGVIVLGIPRGGVETAYYVAQDLQAELSILVARKLGHPKDPELAFGAIAEDGSLYLVPSLRLGVPPEFKQMAFEQQKREIQRRIALYRDGKPLPPLKDRIVILVDDGIATGATLFAAIELCKHQEAAKIVVAAPVGSSETVGDILKAAHEVIVLAMPSKFYSVSQYYESFPEVEDESVITLLQQWERETKKFLNTKNA